MSRIEELKKKRDEIKVQLLEESKNVLRLESANIFERYPQLDSYSWTQFTPYFNDGEQCVFRAYTEDICLHGDSDAIQLNESEILDDITHILDQFDCDVFQELFGDHVEVTVSRDGVDVSEYDHE